MDTTSHPELINTRFAYVSVSRASEEARIYTNNASTLAERLSADVSKTSAVQLDVSPTATQQPASTKEPPMNNSNEQSQEEQRRQFQTEAHIAHPDKSANESTDHRHYAPIQTALREEANGYDWKRETGDIQSYQHREHYGWLHIDPTGNFYNRQAQPVSREMALEQAGHVATLGKDTNSQSLSALEVGGFAL